MGTHPIFESDFDCLTEREIEKATECPTLIYLPIWTMRRRQSRLLSPRQKRPFKKGPFKKRPFKKKRKSRMATMPQLPPMRTRQRKRQRNRLRMVVSLTMGNQKMGA